MRWVTSFTSINKFIKCCLDQSSSDKQNNFKFIPLLFFMYHTLGDCLQWHYWESRSYMKVIFYWLYLYTKSEDIQKLCWWHASKAFCYCIKNVVPYKNQRHNCTTNLISGSFMLIIPLLWIKLLCMNRLG